MVGNRAKVAKIEALVDRGATTGEQQAATAALERVELKLPTIPPKDDPLSDGMVRRLPLPEKGNQIRWDTTVPGSVSGPPPVAVVASCSIITFAALEGAGATRSARFQIGRPVPPESKPESYVGVSTIRRIRSAISRKPGQPRPWTSLPIDL